MTENRLGIGVRRPMLLGLDFGTSSVKALLMEEGGAFRVRAPPPTPCGHPDQGGPSRLRRTGGVPFWKATEAAVGQRGEEVKALGLSGQMHGVVLTDEGGFPASRRPMGRCQIRRRAGGLPGAR